MDSLASVPVIREFTSLYVAVDLAWLFAYAGILYAFEHRLALVVGLAAGLVFFAVDYGLFYLVLGTREVHGADPFWLLLWLSMSYGFTTFTWIWLLLDRDRRALEWSVLTILGWVVAGFVGQSLGGGFSQFSIARGTSYQGVMAVILVVGYLVLALRNLRGSHPRVNLVRLLVIGVGVQFAWEAVLLVTGIRPWSALPLLRNSLVETNLGVPYLYLIHRAVRTRPTRRPRA